MSTHKRRMDSNQNPFLPGAGAPPPYLAGRDQVLDQAQLLLGRVKEKMSEKSLLLTGQRGVGKTVLLHEIDRLAIRTGYRTVVLESHGNKSLAVLLIPPLRKLLFELDRASGGGSKAKRGLAVLKGFINGLGQVSLGDIEIGLDIDPENGTADSGDLESDLPNLFVAVAEAAEERKIPVALLIDELQYFSKKELGALIMAMHKMQQRQLPLVLIGAGLPILAGLAGESKSYAERLFSFPIVGALSQEDAAKALRDPAEKRGVAFEAQALEEIFRLTNGFPYFLQEWGYQAWNIAPSSLITRRIVQDATPKVIRRLDQNFFRVTFDRLAPGEKNFLRAIADLGLGAHRTGDIADALGHKPSNLTQLRERLIKKGMIYSPAYGMIDFDVPLFNGFMVRAIPEFKRQISPKKSSTPEKQR